MEASSKLQYKELLREEQWLESKIDDLRAQRDELKLVSGTLEKLEDGRKCFHAIGGVLTERTVGEVRPIVNENFEGVKKVVEGYLEKLDAVVREKNSIKPQDR